jgi:hypothetical protein
MVARKLYVCPVPGMSPVLWKMSVLSPAAEVPSAVLTIEVAMAMPSPAWEILPCTPDKGEERGY